MTSLNLTEHHSYQGGGVSHGVSHEVSHGVSHAVSHVKFRPC